MSGTSLFSTLTAAPPDAILGLNEAFKADPNPEKMNLSVGVYKDASGGTPILEAVKTAEQRLVDSEATKGYLPIDGPPEFARHVGRLVFGRDFDLDRVATLQTPGGTGGLRVAAGMLHRQLGRPTVWMPNPTWANHAAVFAAEDVPTQTYRYLTADRRGFDFEAMIEDLTSKTKPGDVVLLHACCHNPTGVDPTPDQWERIAETAAAGNLLPLLDFAYQGFGVGVDEDAASIATMLGRCGEAIICNSFSKNFGLYSERVGGVSVVSASPDFTAAVRSRLKVIVRSNYSNPPRHGGAVVITILNDPELTAMWLRELDAMRQRIAALRSTFVDEMNRRGHDFGFLRSQNGMFSYSGLTPMQVDELRTRHGIYIVGSGRINVAGLSESRMDWFCDAVAGVLG